MRLRADSVDPSVPSFLLTLVVAASAAAAFVLPDPLDGWAALGLAVGILTGAYLRWPKVALFSFALLMLFSRTLARWLEPELVHLDELFLPVLIVLAAARTRPWRTWRVHPVREGALVVLFLAGTVSALLNDVPGPTWALGLVLLAKVFAFFYVVVWHDFGARDIRGAAPVLLGVAVVVLIVGALETLDPLTVRAALNLGGVGAGREDLPSIKSLLWHPSTFAWFTAVIGLLLTAGFLVFRRPWMLIGGVLFAAATVLSARRRALVGIAVAVGGAFAAALPAMRVDRTSRRAWAALIVGMVVVGAVFLPSLAGLARLTIDELSDSGTARVALYRTSVVIARDEIPLGVGFGRFGSSVSRNPYSPVYEQYGLDAIPGLAPSDARFVGDAFWARILGETGVIGTAGLVTFTALLALALWRAMRARYADPIATAFVLGAWMVLLQTLVETLASSMFDSPTRSYLFFGIVAAALALQRSERESSSE